MHNVLKYPAARPYSYLCIMEPLHIKTITEFHRLNFLPPPQHPLISVVDYAQVAAAKRNIPVQSLIADYYSISVKRGLSGKMRYGQQEYDFDEGVMYFLAPGQVLQTAPSTNDDVQPSGWILLIHPIFSGVRRWRKSSGATNISTTQ